jgi:hypothetical protein
VTAVGDLTVEIGTGLHPGAWLNWSVSEDGNYVSSIRIGFDMEKNRQFDRMLKPDQFD